MVTQLSPFIDLLTLLELDQLPVTAESRAALQQIKAIRQRADEKDAQAIGDYLDPAQNELVRLLAIFSIQPIHANEALVDKVAQLLLANERDQVRAAAVHALEQMPVADACFRLIGALVNEPDPQFRPLLAQAIYRHPGTGWKEKAGHLVSVLPESGLHPEDLDIAVLIQATRPPVGELKKNRHLLPGFYIQQAIDPANNSQQMRSLLAELILACCRGNVDQANKLINDVAPENAEQVEQLHLLREELGDFTTPAELRDDLEQSYKRPLERINEEIHQEWLKSLSDMRGGLKVRLVTSTSLAIVGLILVSAGFHRIMATGQWAEGLMGALTGLLILILSTAFSKYLKESRQSLFDISVANTAYSAYVQRTRQISSTYSRQYLQGEISTKDLQKADRITGTIMQDTVKALRTDRQFSLDELLEDLGS